MDENQGPMLLSNLPKSTQQVNNEAIIQTQFCLIQSFPWQFFTNSKT